MFAISANEGDAAQTLELLHGQASQLRLDEPKSTPKGAWVSLAKTLDHVMQMPAHLWLALEMARTLMGFDVSQALPH